MTTRGHRPGERVAAAGNDAESRKSMGIAVIGGLLLGSVLALYVIPAMYTFLAARERRRVEIDLPEDVAAEPAS